MRSDDCRSRRFAAAGIDPEKRWLDALYHQRSRGAVLPQRTYDFDKCLYVVGNEQKLHFEQLKRVVELMGYPYSEDIVHVNFGLVLQDGKKMSTRKGKTVKLINVLDEAVALSLEYIKEKFDLRQGSNRERLVSAPSFSTILKTSVATILSSIFKTWSIFGQTGPYLNTLRSGSTRSYHRPTLSLAVMWMVFGFEQDHVYELMKTIDAYPNH